MKKIKNKRLISWAYIWRFILLTVISIAVCYGIIKLAALFFQNGDNIQNVENYTTENLIIYGLNLNILSAIVKALVFSIASLFGWKIIHRNVLSKAEIEKQNEKYVLRSVGIVTGIIMIIIISTFFYDPIASAFGLNNTATISETRDELTKGVNMSKDYQDLIINQDMYVPQGFLMSVKMFDFDVNHLITILEKVLLIDWIIAVLMLIEVLSVIVLNQKKIKNSITDNTLDDNGNIVPTQSKMRKQYKILLIICQIVLVLITIIAIANYIDDYRYSYLYNNHDYNQHIPIKQSRLYSEQVIPIKDIDVQLNENNNEEEYDEDMKNWLKLEHENEWYLNNHVTIGEANKFKLNNKKYEVDKEYINYMYVKVDNFIKEINQYLDSTENKNLYSIEEKFNIKFDHIGINTFVYILDNKNLITGVGIQVFVDNFTDKNVMGISVWDIDGALKELKDTKDVMTVSKTMDNIENEMSYIYADMQLKDIIPILGNSYVVNCDDYSKTYTWYDRQQNYIVFQFEYEDNNISRVTFYKKNYERILQQVKDELCFNDRKDNTDAIEYKDITIDFNVNEALNIRNVIENDDNTYTLQGNMWILDIWTQEELENIISTGKIQIGNDSYFIKKNDGTFKNINSDNVNFEYGIFVNEPYTEIPILFIAKDISENYILLQGISSNEDVIYAWRSTSDYRQIKVNKNTKTRYWNYK